MKLNTFSISCLAALIGNAVPLGSAHALEALTIELTRVSYIPPYDATYCSSDDEKVLAHPDGGVMNIGQICVTLHEDPEGSLAINIGTSVTWMNHWVAVASFIQNFTLASSPGTPFRSVNFGGGRINCGATPFGVDRSFEIPKTSGLKVPLLLNASDRADLTISWYTADDSLC